MAKGLSIHIGLNYVDQNHYNGWDGKLSACENDAEDMKVIAKNQGFQMSILLRENATLNNVKSEIKKAADVLKEGDILFLSYSGHGGQLPDLNSDEDDGQDETWCLYDGQLIDDELKESWTWFKEDVRILVISDSCHSGTIIKSYGNKNTCYTDNLPKYMDSDISSATYFKNKKYYDDRIKNLKDIKTEDIKATVKLISGCQDNQYSYDGTFNGQFTGKLKMVWNGGMFKGNYYQFHKKIMNLLPSYQTPNYLTAGKTNIAYGNQIPFMINATEESK